MSNIAPDNHANLIRATAADFFDVGLTVVPYFEWDAMKTAHDDLPAEPRGKAPIFWRRPPYERVECRSLAELDPWLRRHPRMNLAILGMIQIDCDDAASIDLVRELGISRDNRCWFVKSRRGWKAFYRIPEHSGDLHNHTSGVDGTHLDFLINSSLIVPPSIHPKTGVHYVWSPTHNPRTIPFADVQEPPPLILGKWRQVIEPRRETSMSAVTEITNDEFSQSILRALEAYAPRGLKGPNGKGFITGIRCPLPEHGTADKSAGFGYHDKNGSYNCFKCGGGNAIELARKLRITTPTRAFSSRRQRRIIGRT